MKAVEWYIAYSGQQSLSIKHSHRCQRVASSSFLAHAFPPQILDTSTARLCAWVLLHYLTTTGFYAAGRINTLALTTVKFRTTENHYDTLIEANHCAQG